MSGSSPVIRVLVVDDSAFVRKVIRQMLTRSPFIEVVGTARDGNEALELVESLRPDVVTLDLMMPGLDGVGFLNTQMARRPVAVVVCSITHESGAAAIQALEAGAVDFVQKPSALATDRILEMADELVAKVKAAASVPLSKLSPPRAPIVATSAAPVSTPARARGADVVVVGVSTGGPQGLRQVIPLFPEAMAVPVVIVLHMPVGYTAMYAHRLNELSEVDVREAAQGDEVRAGSVLLAPAGRHLTFRRVDGVVRVHLDVEPAASPYRPSVDELFRSAAEVFGSRTLGVVLTGMGNDGTRGAREIKSAGGRVITEAESSCVVYGMPRAVVEAGASDRSAPLTEMAAAIQEML